MMNQFDVVDGWLCITDISRYDFWFGFRRLIKEVPK